MPTKTKPQVVRFLSEHKSLKLIRRCRGEIILPNGNVASNPKEPEVSYWFTNGELTVRSDQDWLEDKIDPETGDVTKQDALSWLRDHSDYGLAFHEVEPVAPNASEILSAVAMAAAAGDVAELHRLGDEEAESWNRGEVLDVITDAIARIAVPETKG